MADPIDDKTEGAPPYSVHVDGADKKGFNWLPWLLLGLGILALLLALSRCNRHDAVATDNTTVTNTTTVTNSANEGNVVGTTPTVSTATAAGVSGLGAYLKGTEAAPRTFTFEKLNFDTAKSDVRPADKDEVSKIAAVMKQYSGTHVRVVGYADARGSDAANQKLGQARADAVKAALVSDGTSADRIETASGGSSDPVDANATAAGRAENRRTELVVTQR